MHIKVVYAEQADHEYLHVATIDTGPEFEPGLGYIITEGTNRGCLAIRDNGGDFQPDCWNFIDSDKEPGTYHRDDITEMLLANTNLAGLN